MVQETWGSIVGIIASLITIPVHVHVVHFNESVQHALIRLTVAGCDVRNCLAKPGPSCCGYNFWHCCVPLVHMDLLTVISE